MEAQAQERARQRTLDKQRDEAFASDMRRTDNIAVILDQRQDNDRKQINREIVEFRERHQRVEDRREFDIFDPDSKRKDIPARESDDDPRLTVSGLQLFQGEDLNSPARIKMQKEQSRAWYQQQMAEKERNRREAEEADRLYALKMREMDQRAVQLELAEQNSRQALLMATKSYQKAQVMTCDRICVYGSLLDLLLVALPYLAFIGLRQYSSDTFLTLLLKYLKLYEACDKKSLQGGCALPYKPQQGIQL